MGYFKKDDRFGDKRGGNRRSFGGRNNDDRQMFEAVCSSCGKPCKVPFQPSGNKPVYCSDCFDRENQGGGQGRFDDRRRERPDYGGSRSGGGDYQTVMLLKEISSKLERIFMILETKGLPKESEE